MNAMLKYPVEIYGEMFATAFPPFPIDLTKIFGVHHFDMPI